MNKAIIAMSGGVDSSVAAFLMKERGFECIGVTMKLFQNEDAGIPKEHTCCSLDDIEDAKQVARRLSMPHYVFNFSERFMERVVDPFVNDYENGRTPNPCIDCNRYLKFEKLFNRAKELEYDYVVTGHYAIIDKDETTGRYLLKKAVDNTKDQSYVLYSLTQDQLAHVEFPLGRMAKTEARDIAEKEGFINARKADSQDICFVPDGKYADFIKRHTGKNYKEGNFVDINGNILGRHKGIICYTVGQRKGLGISYSEPLYVKEINPKTNEVILAKDSELYSSELDANNINLISVPEIKEPMHVVAKVRYRHEGTKAVVIQTGPDSIHVTFDEPVRAITKGQAVVLYDGDVVVGGGTII